MANNFEIVFTPASFVPDATNGPAQAALQNRPFLAYDDTTKETAYSYPVRLPDAYTGSGTLKADVYYMMASATSGKVNWEVQVEAVTASDALDLDSASSFDTANAGDETVPGTAGYLAVMTITLTNNDSCAAGDYLRIAVARDAADATNDTASGDGRILQVIVREEV